MQSRDLVERGRVLISHQNLTQAAVGARRRGKSRRRDGLRGGRRDERLEAVRVRGRELRDACADGGQDLGGPLDPFDLLLAAPRRAADARDGDAHA